MKRIAITLAVTVLITCALGYGVPAMMQMSQARQDQQEAAQAAEQSRNVKAIAKSVGADPDRMEAGMNPAANSAVLQSNHDLADTIGVAATPSFVIGDQVIVGAIPPETLAELIKKAGKG